VNAFDKISINYVIWYTLPGAVLIFFILLPIGIVIPDMVFSFISGVGVFGLLLISVILGFMLDGLKLFRFRPNYQKIRKTFYKELQEVLGTKQDPYYLMDYMYTLMKETRYESVRFYVAVWVMLGQMSVSIIITAITLWGFFILSVYLGHSYPVLLGEGVSEFTYYVFCASAFAVSTLAGCRIMAVSLTEQKKSNQMYLDFAKSNKLQIQNAINHGYVKPESEKKIITSNDDIRKLK